MLYHISLHSRTCDRCDAGMEGCTARDAIDALRASSDSLCSPDSASALLRPVRMAGQRTKAIALSQRRLPHRERSPSRFERAARCSRPRPPRQAISHRACDALFACAHAPTHVLGARSTTATANDTHGRSPRPTTSTYALDRRYRLTQSESQTIRFVRKHKPSK